MAFFEPDSGALFTGDAVLGRGTSFIDPPGGDLVAYLRSLKRMAALEPRTIYPGHGPVGAAGAREAPRVPRAIVKSERTQVLAALADGPRTIAEMVEVIYADHPKDGAPVGGTFRPGASAEARRRGSGRAHRQDGRRSVDRLDAEDVSTLRPEGQGQGSVLQLMLPCDAAGRGVVAPPRPGRSAGRMT